MRSSVEGSKASPLARTAAPVGGTSPGTTGRVGTTAAVVVVHGWQGRTNRAVGQGVGHRTASSLAHLSSNLLQYKPAGARALKRVKSKLKLTLRLGWRIPQKKLNLKFCKRNFLWTFGFTFLYCVKRTRCLHNKRLNWNELDSRNRDTGPENLFSRPTRCSMPGNLKLVGKAEKQFSQP